MRIGIGCDHAGLALKKEVICLIEGMGHVVEDMGAHEEVSVDYPDYARAVCEAVMAGTVHKGVLICGTGIGMSIAANKISGIRAALCHDTYSARATREHNDSNVLCMGQRVIGPGLAREIVKTWLEGEYAAGKHMARIGKVMALEKPRL